MSNEAITEEFLRLCREGSKEEIMAFHREHEQKVLEELEARSNRRTRGSGPAPVQPPFGYGITVQ